MRRRSLWPRDWRSKTISLSRVLWKTFISDQQTVVFLTTECYSVMKGAGRRRTQHGWNWNVIERSLTQDSPGLCVFPSFAWDSGGDTSTLQGQEVGRGHLGFQVGIVWGGAQGPSRDDGNVPSSVSWLWWKLCVNMKWKWVRFITCKLHLSGEPKAKYILDSDLVVLFLRLGVSCSVASVFCF